MIRTEVVITRETSAETLPALVDRAASALSAARSHAELLEARHVAGFAFDAAKRAARILEAQGAHDALVAAAHRARADALLIESNATRRLADEYGTAKESGEVAKSGARTDLVPSGNEVAPTSSDLGLSRKMIMEGRRMNAAEAADPGVIERAVQAVLDSGEGPTRADIKRAIGPTAYLNERAADEEREIHTKRDFRNLRKLWNAATPEARQQFRDYIAKA